MCQSFIIHSGRNLMTTTVVVLGLLFVYSLILFLFRQEKIVIGQIYVTTGN
jgi:hypothetical protein